MLFTVAAPPPSHNCAGMMCLHELMRCIRELGHEVHHIDYTKSGRMEVSGVLIVPEVFPEIAIPHVRWCLNKPGLLSGPKSYPKGVICFHYCPEIEDATRAASHDGTSTEFMLGTIEIPKDDYAVKQFKVWYRGKHQGGIGIHMPFELQMTRTWPPTKEEYWNLLLRSLSLYSYDDFSAVNLEAHLCGANVFVKGKPYTPPDYADKLLWNDESNKNRVSAFVDTLLSKM